MAQQAMMFSSVFSTGHVWFTVRGWISLTPPPPGANQRQPNSSVIVVASINRHLHRLVVEPRWLRSATHKA